MSNGTLNYNKIKSSLNKSSRFFVGIPRGGPKQGQHYNGIWHREGVTKDKPAGEKIKMVVKLVTMQPYNKKSYMYDRWVKQNYPKLIRKNFKKQMDRMVVQIKKRKLRKMRKITT